MKLIAKVTIVTGAGEVAPGGDFEIKDKAEAESLIARGLAAEPVKSAAKAEAEAKAKAEAEAKAKAEAEAKAKAEAEAKAAAGNGGAQ
ncbi:hypothetical protein [Pseudazoarcus pumilus]|uniref:hypothetical protein n=1 Tax=Pseudazoarcus pumilus TaxID=2067960 RepID=UPI0018F89B25|nr:hypothetical protein [Pseudazoarcus pumilus]